MKVDVGDFSRQVFYIIVCNCNKSIKTSHAKSVVLRHKSNRQSSCETDPVKACGTETQEGPSRRLSHMASTDFFTLDD